MFVCEKVSVILESKNRMQLLIDFSNIMDRATSIIYYRKDSGVIMLVKKKRRWNEDGYPAIPFILPRN